MEKVMLLKGKELSFILAGTAIFTAVNIHTNNRFTFKVTDINRTQAVSGDLKKELWFVKVLTGPDNSSDYAFIGSVKPDGNRRYFYTHSAKARITESAQSVVCFRWLIKALQEPKFPDFVKIYHEGRCGRCGRRLTVPESIMSGYGPECIGKMMGL